MDPALDAAWSQWKTTYSKEYPPEEEEHRRSVWESNWKKVEEHNREAAEGKHTYTMGMNQFADLTNEEFKERMLMSK